MVALPGTLVSSQAVALFCPSTAFAEVSSLFHLLVLVGHLFCLYSLEAQYPNTVHYALRNKN